MLGLKFARTQHSQIPLGSSALPPPLSTQWSSWSEGKETETVTHAEAFGSRMLSKSTFSTLQDLETAECLYLWVKVNVIAAVKRIN